MSFSASAAAVGSTLATTTEVAGATASDATWGATGNSLVAGLEALMGSDDAPTGARTDLFAHYADASAAANDAGTPPGAHTVGMVRAAALAHFDASFEQVADEHGFAFADFDAERARFAAWAFTPTGLSAAARAADGVPAVWAIDPLPDEPFADAEAAATWDRVPGPLLHAYATMRTPFKSAVRGVQQRATAAVRDVSNDLGQLAQDMNPDAVSSADGAARPPLLSMEEQPVHAGEWSRPAKLRAEPGADRERGAVERARVFETRRFEPGWNQLREQTDDPAAGEPWSEAGDGGVTLEGVAPGRAGYGGQLLMAAGQAAIAAGDQWGMAATPVTPVDGPLDAGMAQQLQFIDSIYRQKASQLLPPVHLEDAYTASVSWAGANMAALERHKLEQHRWCTAYNSWTNLANMSHVAKAELVETAGLLGFDTGADTGATQFVEGLEVGLRMACRLVDAPVLGDDNDHS